VVNRDIKLDNLLLQPIQGLGKPLVKVGVPWGGGGGGVQGGLQAAASRAAAACQLRHTCALAAQHTHLPAVTPAAATAACALTC
jgi:hypothetical protein